jgi:hypothetical protein
MQTTKTKGCGCSGTGDCGCKPARLPPVAPAPCSPCEIAAFVRPRFFAGQLLTEDDLDALIDYTVAKNRFHNARLFGAGVVCGLAVQCAPCQNMKVVVESGYALDCCGNDLVLTCDQTLDLAAMVRTLTIAPGCKDPCPPPAPVPGQKPDETKPATYYLYAVYAERFEQPVMSYPVGDNCDAATCEPTRILEGVTFELRCTKTDPPPTRCDVLAKNKENGPSRVLYELGRIGEYAALERPLKISYAEATRNVTAFERARFDAELTKMSSAQDRYVARYQTMEALDTSVSVVLSNLEQKHLFDEKKLEVVREYVRDTAASILQSEGKDAPTELDRALSLVLANAMARPHDGAKLRRVALDDVWVPAMYVATKHHVELTKATLRHAGHCGTPDTDCNLSEAIDAVPTAIDPNELNARKTAISALDESSKLVRRVFHACDCRAVNPPCTGPCTDTSVLLASIEVDNCKVIKICNTVRQYVLAPTTLRYWDATCSPAAGCCGQPGKRTAPCTCATRTYGQELGAVRERAYDPYAELADMRRRLDDYELRLKVQP